MTHLHMTILTHKMVGDGYTDKINLKRLSYYYGGTDAVGTCLIEE